MWLSYYGNNLLNYTTAGMCERFGIKQKSVFIIEVMGEGS